MAKFRVLRDDFPDTDIESTDYSKFALHEAKQTQKIAYYDEVNVTVLSNTNYASATIALDLGYIPIINPTIKHGTKGYPYMGTLMPYIEVPAYGGGTTSIFFKITWDATEILIEAFADVFGNPASNEAFTIEVYTLLDQL